MKKFAAIFAAVALIAVAAPVFAATNPFMDVPMNSWAYDAVASLAAKGILSGYPDGLYKGKQAMTRYEAASMVARALAYVDITKADKQDVEMLKKLLVEFKDELDALGVRVDALEEGFGKMNSRLGGWKINGRVRLDVNYAKAKIDAEEFDDHMGSVAASTARLEFQRYFGENEDMLFYARLNMRDGNAGIDYFRVTMPFFFESKLTVGRTDYVLDRPFVYGSSGPGRYDTGSWMTDANQPMIALEKNFSLGNFTMYLGHPGFGTSSLGAIHGAWELAANFDMKFHEKFGFNLGGQYLVEDDWNFVVVDGVRQYGKDYLKSAFTGWVGFDANFMEGLALHATAFFQSISTGDRVPAGIDVGGTAWRLALDVKQDVLKFTSFWAEYNKLPQGFFLRNGIGALLIQDADQRRDSTEDIFGSIDGVPISFMIDDTKVLRLAANQQWNDKWSTWIQWAKMDVGDIGGFNNFALGVEYAYNANTSFGLNWISVVGKDGFDGNDASRIRFTTQVDF